MKRFPAWLLLLLGIATAMPHAPFAQISAPAAPAPSLSPGVPGPGSGVPAAPGFPGVPGSGPGPGPVQAPAPSGVDGGAPAAAEATVPAPTQTASPASEPGLGGEATAELSAVERELGMDATAEAAVPQPFRLPPLRQFGYDFFRPAAPGFPPATEVPVPSDYVLGPGDRVVVTLWGSLDGRYELEVDRSGEITLPRVGTVRVWGTRFGDLREVVRAQLARVFKDFELDVNLGKLRLLSVFVVGEVQAPGGYRVSALSTVLNALSLAGGPARRGTLRAVEVRRDGRVVETLDLYDFFLRGDKSRDVRLQDGDTVFVPVIGPVAGIGGNVRRPAVYELRGEKTLRDLLALAGGIEPTGYLQRVQISRVEAHQRVLVRDFQLSGPPEGDLDAQAAVVAIQDRDVVKVFPIDRSLQGYVRLAGYALRPGDYAFRPGMRVRDLVLPDNLLPEYYPGVAELTRLHPPDFHPRVSFLDLGRALAGEPEHDRELWEFDTVRLFSRWEMEERPQVGARGEVLRPGTYRLLQGMRLRDLVMQAGNLTRNASRKSAELLRVRQTATVRETYRVTVDLERALAGDQEHDLALAPDDQLVVHQAPLIPVADYTVKVSGEVRRPGEVRLREGMTVRDLLQEAGGPHPIRAYLKNAELNRIRIEHGTVTSFPLVLDLERALAGDPLHDVALEPYDELIVRRLPNWVEETERYVTLGGEVRFPGLYPIYKGERLSSVLERAGGFTDKAYLRAARFTRVSVREQQQLRLAEVIQRAEADIAQKQADLASVASSEEELQSTQVALEGLRRSLDELRLVQAQGRVVLALAPLPELRATPYDIELLGGDALHVPPASNAVTVLGQVYNPTTVLALPGRTVGDFLAQAGGPTREAAEKEVYVIRADGSVVSRQQGSVDGRQNWFERSSGRFLNMELHSGDTVVVPRKLDRIAWMREIKDITQILANVALSAGVLIAAGL